MVSESFFNVLNFKQIRSFANRLSQQIGDLIKLSVRLKGFRLYANSIDRIIAILFWKWSILEGFESKYILSKIEPGWTVIDIGANIGFYTVQFSKKVGKNGKVLAVEPSFNNVYLLKKNIRANRLKNVSIIEKAVSSKTGIGKLYLSTGHSGDHRIYNTINKRKCIPIQTITIDNLTKNEKQVDLIKMDIQGAEYLSISGMSRTIKKFPNVKIVSEFSPKLLTESGGKPDQFLDYFLSEGFSLKYFNEKSKNLSRTTKKELLENICIGNNYVSLYLERHE
jgi:FkbM family methyltransferase